MKQVFDVPVLQVVGESGGADKIFPKGDISERIDEQIVHDVPVSQSLEVGGIRSFSMVQSRINEDSTKINKQGGGPQTLDTMRDDIDEKTCVRQAVEHGA